MIDCEVFEINKGEDIEEHFHLKTLEKNLERT